ADPQWAEWSMPNYQTDVSQGAPNLEGYKDNLDGTVTDKVTGLMWQQTADIGYSQVTAIAHCQASTLGGYTGWRLPTLIEVLSLIDSSSSDSFINTAAFPGTIGEFMTSTLVAGDSSKAWYVMFVAGATTTDDVSVVDYSVRCVR